MAGWRPVCGFFIDSLISLLYFLLLFSQANQFITVNVNNYIVTNYTRLNIVLVGAHRSVAVSAPAPTQNAQS